MLEEQEVQEAASNLNAIYERIQDKQFFLSMNGDGLSYTASKVATIKARLAEVKRLAESEAKDAETEYKRVKAVAFKRLTEGDDKVSATAASTLLYAEDDVVEASVDMNNKEALWNFIKSLVADGHDFIESIRSRIIDLQNSRKDESIR